MKVCFMKTSTLIACILLFVSITLAVPKGNGKAKGKDKDSRAAVSIFMQDDRDLIRRHFSGNQGNLPPGLAKRGGDLPPGLEKQLQRNGHLPPGLEKRLNPFPAELERRLPPLREGLVRGVIGDSVIIMERKTSRILDAFGIR
jgi:hypothetical protein